MAKYDRSFLVPYLQDICALHMAEQELTSRMNDTEKAIMQMKQGHTVILPNTPRYEEEWDLISVLFAGIGLFLMMAPLTNLGAVLGEVPLGASIVLSIVGFPLGYGIWKGFRMLVNERKERNQILREKYKEELKQYEKHKKEAESAYAAGLAEIPRYEQWLNYYSWERDKTVRILEKCYSAGVIPTQYRDIYAAVYLYDYFSNSRADDLDQVLNTYVLEQIKAKLDVIIENQRLAILNQRMIISNQQTALEEQRAHNEYMRRKARQIASSMEEQNQYLAMVESNTAATAFFSAATYLK